MFSKRIACGCALLAFGSLAHATSFEFRLGNGVSEHALAVKEEGDNSISELKAGDGVGALLGLDVAKFGPVRIEAKGGFHLGFMNSEASFGTVIKNRFSYFPLSGNAVWQILPDLSLFGGLNYLFLPRQIVDVESSLGNRTGQRNMNSSVGYQFGARYSLTPRSQARGSTTFVSLSYMTNSLSVSSTTGDIIGLGFAGVTWTGTKPVEAFKFGLGAMF